ncbi:MAG: hypothetical protein RLZZ426_272 [Actinomycetota bacterium]|jgi:hypothetical protein
MSEKSLSGEVVSFLAELTADPEFGLSTTSDPQVFQIRNHPIQIAIDDVQSQISVWAMALVDISLDDFAYETLNRWTAFKFARFLTINNQAIVEVVLPAHPFVPQHLLKAILDVANALDQLDDEISTNQKFALGGRRFRLEQN